MPRSLKLIVSNLLFVTVLLSPVNGHAGFREKVANLKVDLQRKKVFACGLAMQALTPTNAMPSLEVGRMKKLYPEVFHLLKWIEADKDADNILKKYGYRFFSSEIRVLSPVVTESDGQVTLTFRRLIHYGAGTNKSAPDMTYESIFTISDQNHQAGEVKHVFFKEVEPTVFHAETVDKAYVDKMLKVLPPSVKTVEYNPETENFTPATPTDEDVTSYVEGYKTALAYIKAVNTTVDTENIVHTLERLHEEGLIETVMTHRHFNDAATTPEHPEISIHLKYRDAKTQSLVGKSILINIAQGTH